MKGAKLVGSSLLALVAMAIAQTNSSPPPLRDAAVFDGKAGFTFVQRKTIVIDDTLKIAATSGTGPDLDMSGYIIRANPNVDWTGKPLVEVAGIRANIRGLVIESDPMKHPPAYGVCLSSLWDSAGVHQSGGSAAIYDCSVRGVFTRSCLLLDSGEQYSIINCNFENRTKSEGYVVILANGGERGPAHSMTDLQFLGGDYAAYWATKSACFLLLGEVQDVTIVGGHGAVNGPMVKVNDQRSVNCSAFGFRLETQTPQPIFSGTRTGWTLTRCSNHAGSVFPSAG